MNSLLQLTIVGVFFWMNVGILNHAAAQNTSVSQPPALVETWHWVADIAAPTDANTMTADAVNTGSGGWQDAIVGQDVFNGRVGYAWFRTTLPNVSSPPHSFHFESVDDNATVYLNGKQLDYHEGWNDPFDAPKFARSNCSPILHHSIVSVNLLSL